MYSLFIRNFLNIARGNGDVNFNKYPYKVNYPIENSLSEEKDHSSLNEELQELSLTLSTYKENHIILHKFTGRVIDWIHLTKTKKKF